MYRYLVLVFLLVLLPTPSTPLTHNESTCTYIPALDSFGADLDDVASCPNTEGTLRPNENEDVPVTPTIQGGVSVASFVDVWVNSSTVNAAYAWLPSRAPGTVVDYWFTLTLLGDCEPLPQVSVRVLPIPLQCEQVVGSLDPPDDDIPGGLPYYSFAPLVHLWMIPDTMVVSSPADQATNVSVGSESVVTVVPPFSNGAVSPARFSHFGTSTVNGPEAQVSTGARTNVCAEEAPPIYHRRARGFWLRLKRVAGAYGSAVGPECGIRATLVEQDVSSSFPALDIPATPAPPGPAAPVPYVTELPDTLPSASAYADARGCDPVAPVLATTNWSTGTSSSCPRGCWVASLGPEGDCRNDDPADVWIGDSSSPFASSGDKVGDEKERRREAGLGEPVCNMAGDCVGFTCRCYGSLGAFDCSEEDASDLRTTEVVNAATTEATIHGLGQARFAAVISSTNTAVDLTIRLNLRSTLRTGVNITSVVSAVRVVPGLASPADVEVSGYNDLVNADPSAVRWRAECNHTGHLGTVWQNAVLTDAIFGVPTFADDTDRPVVLRILVGEEDELATLVADACADTSSTPVGDDARLGIFRIADSCPGVLGLTRSALDEAGAGATIVIATFAEVEAGSTVFFGDLLGNPEDEVILRYEATMALDDPSAVLLTAVGALLSAVMLLYVLWTCFNLTNCNPATADDRLHDRFGPHQPPTGAQKAKREAAAAASADNDVGAGDVVEKVEGGDDGGGGDATADAEAGTATVASSGGVTKAAALSADVGEAVAREASGALFAVLSLFELLATELKVILNIVLMYRVILQVYVPLPSFEFFDAFGAVRALAEAFDKIAAVVDVVSFETFNCGGSVAVFAPFIFVLGVLVLVAIMQRGLLARVREALHGPGSPSPVRRALAKAGVTVALYFTQLLIAAMAVSALNLAGETRTCSSADRAMLDLAQTVAPILLVFLYVALVVVFGGYGDEGYKLAGLARLVVGPLQGAGRLILVTGGVWVQTMTDGVVRVPSALGGDAGSSKTDAREILAVQGASRGLFWILLPGGLVGAKLAEAANKRPIFVASKHEGTLLPSRTIFDRLSYAFNVASFVFSFGSIFGAAPTMIGLALATAAASWLVGVVNALKG